MLRQINVGLLCILTYTLCETSLVLHRKARKTDDGAIWFPDMFENANKILETSTSTVESTTPLIGERSLIRVGDNCPAGEQYVNGKCRRRF